MSKPKAVQFERSVPVLGTGRLQDSFDVDAHWNISTSHLGGEPWVMLSRDAVPEKNVPAVKAFVVRGVGFVESLEDVRDGEQARVSRDGEGGPSPRVADVAGDGGAAAQAGAADPKPAQGGPKKASRRVKP